MRPVRPSNGAQVRIDAGLCGVGRVTQRLKDSAKAERGCEIDHALNAVLEPKRQAIIAGRSFCNKMSFDMIYSRGAMGLISASALAKFYPVKTLAALNAPYS